MALETENSKPKLVNENVGEVTENYSEEVLQSGVLLEVNNVELPNNAYPDQSTDTTDNMTERINLNTNYDSEDDILQNASTVKKKRFIAIADSDSEEENVPLATPLSDSENENFSKFIQDKKKKCRRLVIADSDSDIENEIVTPHNKSSSGEGLNIEERVNSDINPNEDLIPEIPGDNITVQNYNLSTLCDSDSSDEEIDKENKEKEYNFEEVKSKPYKKISRPKTDEEKNPRKMTGKEAAELRKEIKSESQRMVREMNVSLPYHKPKSYTLKEFLARRPKFVSANSHDVRTPPSVAIKMSTEQLAVITKKLKEREKEVKEFYKSESESEDVDGDKDYLPPSQDKNKVQETNDHCSKNTNIDSMEPLVSISDETKDVNQYKIDTQDIGSELQNYLEEGGLVKSVGVEGNNMVTEEITNQELNEMTVSVDKNNINSESLMHSEDCVNNSNINDNLNDEETENLENKKEITDSEVVEENNIVCEKPNTAVQNNGDSSMGYEFNLDDLEENSEKPIIEKDFTNDIEIQKPRFEYTDLDREIENFGSNDEEKSNESTVIIPKKVSKLELIKERIANIKPKLSGGPDDVIDLETGVAKPNDVTRLMERFAQHTLKKHTHKNKVKLSIISVESGEIHKETVAMNVEDEDDLLEVEEKPGVRLQKLRDDLQNQIAQKRSEFWQKKAINEECDKEDAVYEGEKEECGADDDLLDDEEEEAEMSELSEDEENFDNHKDTQIKSKKSAFIDEEAEESDIDDDAENDDDIDTDVESVQTKGFPEVDLNENSKSSYISEDMEEQPTKKILRRIVKGFTEDSDDEDDDSGLTTQTADLGEVAKQNFNNIVNQDDDDFLPPHQPQSSQTPVRQMTQSKSEFEFLTPISFITGLQNLNNSASKSLKDSPVTSPFQTTNEPSPLKENNWHHSLQKKLFMDSDITDSQFEEIAGVCSGKFPETQEVEETSAQEIKEANADNEKEIVNVCNGTFPTLDAKGNETQLADLCSGTFPSSLEVEKENSSNNELPSTQDLLNICSGKFTGATQIECTREQETDSNRTAETYMFNTNKELKSLDADQDMIISQLIDEEEMEKFKRKFDSPLLSNTQKRIVEEFEEVMGSGGVIDSDDEDDIIEVKKKKQKRIMFSDDENSDDDEKEEEVIDLHDDVNSEDDEDDRSNIPTDNIGYDSEENEIELVEERAGPRPKPSDFFENEAELSESEWGSADEDEKDLDTLEFEQGDTEKFDEKKLRSDLEKIHVRRLLDDDTREVKMLQELLLEDGELHGTGRERQFRWKNINSMEDGNEERKHDDEVYLDEEESEEQWRKMRYEREMFLKEKQSRSQHLEDDGLLSESQLLKIGHKVIQRSQSNSQGSMPLDKTKVTPDSPDIKQPFSILNKRGSFLSRSDQVLQRLADYNKVTSVTLASTKNSRNFLFQTVSVEKTLISVNQDKKRKATDGTPNAIKKLRLSNNLSPAIRKKNPDKSAKAKLFGNL